MVYQIRYSKDTFYLRNIFRRKTEKVVDLVGIKKVNYLLIIYKIIFSNNHYHFMISTKLFYKSIFQYNSENIEKVLMDKIESNLDKPTN